VGFFLICTVAGWFSGGVYHEDDLTHYLFARWSQFDGRYLLDPWGRPGFTIPYSVPASIGSSTTGLQSCRLFSAMLSAAGAWLAFCSARRLGVRYAWAAIVFVWFQPLFARLSMTTLTETPLAFYLALATWLLLSGRAEWSAAVVALAPVTRDEAIVFLPVWAVALWRQRSRWWGYALLFWATAAHNFASADWLGLWPAARWLEPDGADHYGFGTVLTFVPKLVFACGPVVVTLAILGIRRVRSCPQGWLIVAGPVVWFAAETIIYMRGAYSSGGYSRFLVPICPWLAILASEGAGSLLAPQTARRTLAILSAGIVALWGLCELEFHWRNPVVSPEWQNWSLAGRGGAIVVCLVLAVCSCQIIRRGVAASAATRVAGGILAILLAAGATGFLPLRLDDHQLRVRQFSSAVSAVLQEDRHLLALNRWVYHWTDTWVPWAPTGALCEILDQAAPGTVFVWDRRFCSEPVPVLSYPALLGWPGWRLVQSPELDPGDHMPCLALFERQTVMQAANPREEIQN